MKTFAGKIAAITGAASGLGEALAMQLAEAGCHLALSDVQSDPLSAVAEKASKHGVTCTTHEVDVASREAVEQYARDVQASHGGAHMIFNNAGVALADHVESLSYEDFEWVMNINFWGVVHGTKSFLPLLRQADDAHIINISSLFGLGAVPSQAAYNASKFAVRGFTEALKMELADSPINVSSVHPGGIKTNIVRNGRISESSVSMTKESLSERFDTKLAITTPEKAARTVLQGVLKNRRRILVGTDARIVDKIIRLFPGSYERILRLEKPFNERFAKKDS